MSTAAWVGLVTAIYMAGVFFSVRLIILMCREGNERSRDECELCAEHSQPRFKRSSLALRHNPSDHKDWTAEDTVDVVLGSVFWPVVLAVATVFCLIIGLYMGLRWLMFPRGVETRYARDKRLAAEKKQAALETERLAFEYNLPSISAALTSGYRMDFASDGFARDLEALSRDAENLSRYKPLGGGSK